MEEHNKNIYISYMVMNLQDEKAEIFWSAE
jgi:hypothetical protein